MKFSEQWLREWVNPSLTTEELVAELTMAGLEVDAVEPVAGEFDGVIVGEIISAEQHPDADKLRVCSVNGGGETVQVVCGAPNARAGIKVPFATVGANLPGGLKIKKAKLRGVESQGMLCAETELGLGEAGEGLLELADDAPVGASLRDYLGLDDQIIDVDLTPNRADCLSIRGVARDVATLKNEKLTEPTLDPVAASHDETLDIRIDAPEDCPRYAGRIIRNIDLSQPTPLWMVEKLRRSGIRSIDAAVDVTNYVMLELGQPLHAFDLDTLDKGIVVRKASADETLTLLDGKELKLNEEALLICDHSKALALAGIMGGEGSGVSEKTQHIFLESAFFAPENIAGRARHYGLHTDSSHRFERGVDFNLPSVAIERATQLLIQICGGEAGPVNQVDTDSLPAANIIELREQRIEQMLGMSVAAPEVGRMLTALGLAPISITGGWKVTVPSWRYDLALEVDLLEEIARLYGYNNLPVTPIADSINLSPKNERRRDIRKLRQRLVSRGYQEAITYSFVEPKLQQVVDPNLKAVELLNPISADMAAMRTSLWPGLLSAVGHNLKRQRQRVRLFETGLRFVPQDGGELKQTPTLAIALTGRRDPESCQEANAQVDFFDLKGDLQALLPDGIDFAPGEHSALHPGQCAKLTLNGETVGMAGALHPMVDKVFDIGQTVFLAEIELAAILNVELPEFQALSRFPAVRRDLAILIDRSIPAGDVLCTAKNAAGEQLIDLKLFDMYQGEGIDTQRKSLALGLTFQSASATLTDEQINTAVENVVQRLQSQYDAQLRA